MRFLSFIIPVAVAGALFSCDNRKVDMLARQNDSLRHELQKAEEVIASFRKVSKTIESLEGFKNVATKDLKGNAAHEVLASRIHGIHDHVVKTEARVNSLNKELRSSRHENSAYVMMVDALKGELQIRVDEVTVLEGSIADVEAMNEELKMENDKAVTGLLSTINEKQTLLAGLQTRLDRLQIDFKNTEAEATYARAQAVEESARKTRFAPAKKKEAFTEALELYKKAKSLGKTEAQFNIESLQKIETASSKTTTDARVF
jgi:hypothetical protein